VGIKLLAKQAHVASLDAGMKGAVVRFYRDRHPNPQRLLRWIAAQKGAVKLRPDGRMVVRAQWEDVERRIRGVRRLVKALMELG